MQREQTKIKVTGTEKAIEELKKFLEAGYIVFTTSDVRKRTEDDNYFQYVTIVKV